MPHITLSPEDIERFWSKVDISGDCWTWTGSKDRDGYGLFSIKCKTVRSHRISYEIANGPLVASDQTLHRCDNPPCVRPDHLYAGSVVQNVKDRDERGRTATGSRSGPSKYPEIYRGESNGNARLTADTVKEIRAEYEAGGISTIGIASKYGIGKSQAHNIVSGKAWRDVE